MLPEILIMPEANPRFKHELKAPTISIISGLYWKRFGLSEHLDQNYPQVLRESDGDLVDDLFTGKRNFAIMVCFKAFMFFYRSTT
jgi:hypothetical protein